MADFEICRIIDGCSDDNCVTCNNTLINACSVDVSTHVHNHYQDNMPVCSIQLSGEYRPCYSEARKHTSARRHHHLSSDMSDPEN